MLIEPYESAGNEFDRIRDDDVSGRYTRRSAPGRFKDPGAP
jgi:hypothetical protein